MLSIFQNCAENIINKLFNLLGFSTLNHKNLMQLEFHFLRFSTVRVKTLCDPLT